MKGIELNLASRPFVNLRPIRRIAVLLWLLGAGLLAVNGLLYWRHFSGRSELRARLIEVEHQIEQERYEVARLQSELASIDLEWQNRQVAMLNSKIDERMFSWSSLFDRLAEVLPREVQLRRVTPRIRQPAGSRGAAADQDLSRSATVDLDLDGSARSGEDLLELVDAFFAHPSFHEPDLVREARQEEATEFSLTVSYLQERRRVEASDEARAAEPEMTRQPDPDPGRGDRLQAGDRVEASGPVEAGGVP